MRFDEERTVVFIFIAHLGHHADWLVSARVLDRLETDGSLVAFAVRWPRFWRVLLFSGHE